VKKQITAIALAALLIASCAPKDSRLPREKESNITANTEMFDQVFVEVYKHLTEELHSLMIIKDGKVIYERYALGHDAEEHHVLWSATKTFTATAIGFARQDGLLDVTDPITEFFTEDEIPQERYDSLSRITIHDLLVMGSGLGDYDYNFEAGEDGTVNPVEFYFNSPIEAEPSGRWRYNNNDTHLAGIIVSRVTGMKLKDYLDEKLFKPLGIRSYDWVEEPSGHNTGAFGLYMPTESIGKMALFMLQKGVWNGKRLLEEDWFDLAMNEQIFQSKGDPTMTPEKAAELHATNDWASGYGYQMWMMRDGRGCRLDGANGQFGIILPKKNAVVVMTSKCWNTSIEMDALWKYIYDEL